MNLADSQATLTVICAIAIVAGLLGVVVPILPGLLLCWLGVLVWAIFADIGMGKWLVLGVVTLLTLIGIIAKYLLPGRNLKRSGVPNRSLLAGGVLGIVGFFVIPVVGLVIGFVLGIWLAELARLGSARLAWPSTWQALKATGLSMLIEFGAGLAIAAVWVAGLLLL